MDFLLSQGRKTLEFRFRGKKQEIFRWRIYSSADSGLYAKLQRLWLADCWPGRLHGACGRPHESAKLGRATPRTWSVCRRTRAQVCSLTRSGRVIGKREQAVEKRGTGVTIIYGQDAVRQPVQDTVGRGNVSITRSFFDRGAPACTSWQALSSAGSPLLESIGGRAAPAERRDGD